MGGKQNVQVVQGARSLADEQHAIDTGHSRLTNPADSKHVIVPGVRELAEAVDLAMWPVNWANHQAFLDLGALVKTTAGELAITISWGGDWPHPFDWGHFELGAGPA